MRGTRTCYRSARALATSSVQYSNARGREKERYTKAESRRDIKSDPRTPTLQSDSRSSNRPLPLSEVFHSLTSAPPHRRLPPSAAADTTPDARTDSADIPLEFHSTPAAIENRFWLFTRVSGAPAVR
ncbi:hypothetical protein EVAR_2319_1 [Eumeta japonica]|uniref:Uncharacterized protein n=1 Tax=Eumeta variegata TaxID=151549 RepID=A0A4C1SFW2_EUMVA|nr:hypothetical protein EVAR_2319_1 [Eumeta japonica]